MSMLLTEAWFVAIVTVVVVVTTRMLSHFIHRFHSTHHKRIVMGPSKLNESVVQKLQVVVDQYKPTWWTNAHVQILLTFLIPQANIQYQRDILALDDGGQAAVDWAIPKAHHHLKVDSPIVVILHGLTGCSRAMRSLCAEALEHGYRPVVYNKRGHGGMKLTTPTLQAFGCIRDLQCAIAHIERTFPYGKLYGVGLSAGSGLLCSYLGATGADSRLEAGVCISPGYNARELFCGNRIHPLYNFLMTQSLKQFLSKHHHELDAVIDVSAAMNAKTIQAFDEQVYMKLHGYDDIDTYWIHNNPMREIEKILRPTLCINALDDPVCTKENIDYRNFETNPLAMLIETGTGSHCAFYEGHIVLKSWMHQATMTYLDHVREFHHQSESAKAF